MKAYWGQLRDAGYPFNKDIGKAMPVFGVLKNTEFLHFRPMCFENEALNLRSELIYMKRIFSLCFAIGMAVILTAQTPNTNSVKLSMNAQIPQEAITLKETNFDFGTIPQGKPVYNFFEVTNTGKDPLVISNVQTSCGCTTPEWSKEPVAPGATTKIRVGYNAAAEGHFEKYITIMYNQNLSKQVKITGNVWRAPSGSAPENSSISLLKQKNN